MPIATLVEWTEPTPGLDSAQSYEDITLLANDGKPMEQLSDWGPGLIAHFASPTDNGGWLVIDVWEDQQSMEAWNERLQGAFGKYERGQDIAPPEVRVLETHRHVT